MPAKQVRSDYDQLKSMAGSFRQQEETCKKTSQNLKGIIEQLNSGQDWVGQGAKAFYQEMDSEVMPAMMRLQNAMAEAGKVTDQIAKRYQDAEEGMSSFWKSLLA